ncbi:MAG: nuclear transport factor 2 family protein [Bacteroidota bacterium]
MTAMQVFQAFGEGIMSGTNAWQEVVSNDVIFTGPVDQVKGIKAFADLNARFFPLVRGVEMKQVVEVGNFVITQVEMQVATQAGGVIALDLSEWYEINDGKIQSIKVYYDAEEFRKGMKAA